MSSAVSAHPAGGLHEEPELTSAKDQQKARALGLTSATGLVIGTVIGAGVFTMPAVLAGAGTISLAVLAVIAVGAMVLAVLFGQLTRRVPDSDGGLYAYARHEFGDFAGYLTGWCYWVQAWAGNAAIVSSWVFYVDAASGIRPSGLGNWGIALVGLWVPAAVNLAGIRQTAWLQNVTVVLKYLPLLFVGVVGWFFVTKANFGAFNASGGGLYSAIGVAAGVALFSFIGVETAAIIAKRVKDPLRNVGRASLLGTGASAIDYLFSACAQLTYLVSRRRPVQGWLMARDLSITVAAVLFSLWVTFAAGYSAVYQAMVVVLAGIILYAFIRARRERLGQVPASTDLVAAVTRGQTPEGQS